MRQQLDPQYTPLQNPMYQTASNPEPIGVSGFAALSAEGQQTVSDYLVLVGRGLPSSPNALSSFERDETLHELQAHLLSLIAGYQELGDTEQAAINAAITQFGRARSVSGGLRRVALRGAFRDRTFWQAAIIAVAAEVVLNFIGSSLFGWNGTVTELQVAQVWNASQRSFLPAAIWLVHLVVVGLITSRITPRYAPLAAIAFSLFRALRGILIMMTPDDLGTPSLLVSIEFALILVAPATHYALVAWLFVRRRSARQRKRA